MANQEHIEKLCQGARSWNTWRRNNPGIIPEFEEAHFTLGQRQLGPLGGQAFNLQHARFKDAFLYFAQLTGAKLCNADLSGADLTHARLDGADLTAATLIGAELDGADFTGADLSAARLENTDLSKTRNLSQTQLEKAKGNRKTRLPDGLTPPTQWLNRNGAEEPTPAAARPKQFVKGHTLNFYSLLNVSPLATQAEIRDAYRRLAKQFHPDLNQSDPAVAEDFKLLKAVFDVLSDPEKRRHYDALMAANSDSATIQAELFN